jgi:drug/metabolite transporter, DME family
VRGEDDRAVVAALFGGAALVLLPVLLAGSPGWLLTGRGIGVTAYLGGLTTAIGYVLYARGLRTTPVAAATTLTLAEPAVAALLGLVILGEHLGGVAVAGLALLAGSLLLLVRPQAGRSPAVGRR